MLIVYRAIDLYLDMRWVAVRKIDTSIELVSTMDNQKCARGPAGSRRAAANESWSYGTSWKGTQPYRAFAHVKVSIM